MGIGHWVSQKWAAARTDLAEQRALDLWIVHESETWERYKAGLPARDASDADLYEYFDRASDPTAMINEASADLPEGDQTAESVGISTTQDTQPQLEADYEAEF